MRTKSFLPYILRFCDFILLFQFGIVLVIATENWAVLLCTSRYFFNARHFINTLAVYESIKSAGFPDERIIFMNAEQDVACNPRNPLGGVLKSNAGIEFFKNFSKYIEIDVKGRDVTIYNFLSVLTGRQTHLSNRLLSGPDSNVFLYMTGHGGDEFFKFQDAEELSAQEFAFAVGEMYDKAMYKEMLIVLDTCQASTMCKYIDVPHVFCIASSQKGENSYAYIPDSDIGIPVMDRFTYAFTDFLMKNYRLKSSLTFHSKSADISLQNFIESLDPYFLKSNPSISSSPESRSCSLSKLQDFIFNSHDFSFSQMTQSYFSSYTSSKSKESHVVELQQDL